MESTVDPEAAILELRRQKVESKFYHARTKILPKQMKKVKTFMSQRVVKKIKQKKTEGSGNEMETEIKTLEGELIKTKALDHIKLATWAFNSQVFKNDEYLKEKLRELGIFLPTTEAVQDSEKLMSVKCFQDAIKSCHDDLNSFVRKLFHEASVKAPVKKPSLLKDMDEGKRAKMIKPLSVDKSFFMDSLNADDSDDSDEEDDLESRVGADGNSEMHGRVAFTDDEEDGSDFDFEEEEVQQQQPKKKRNRLGQVARRRLAEKMYGGEAKHIRSGGLTVQQREEQRKQKSLQRKERTARIKKDAGKTTKVRGSQETVESFNGSSKSSEAVPIKIDPKMHPSWAAKLQQQAKLLQASFQGQKIKFEE